MNRNWNIVKGIRVGDSIKNNNENIKMDIKIKRVVNYEFSHIIFKKNPKNPKNIEKYFKWIKD